MKTRNEIIDAIVIAFRAKAEQEASQSQVDLDYEVIIGQTLTSKLMSLRPDELVRTCDDFRDFGIECCESCHTYYPHYELALLNVESGGQAWICCALDRALNPQSPPEAAWVRRLLRA